MFVLPKTFSKSNNLANAQRGGKKTETMNKKLND